MVSAAIHSEVSPARANAVVDNCDVDKNNPPPQFLPFVGNWLKKVILWTKFFIPQLKDKSLQRSAKGIGQVFSYRKS